MPTHDEEMKTVSESMDEQEQAGQSNEQLAAEYLDRLQRLQAEFENYRKRTVRVRDVAVMAAVAEVWLSVLPLLDQLQLATAAARGDDRIRSGLELVLRQAEDILSQAGLEALSPTGEQFDPTYSEAMTACPDPSPPGTVLSVFRTGYRLGNRVLRPAMVTVSSGPDDGEPAGGVTDGESGGN